MLFRLHSISIQRIHSAARDQNDVCYAGDTLGEPRYHFGTFRLIRPLALGPVSDVWLASPDPVLPAHHSLPDLLVLKRLAPQHAEQHDGDGPRAGHAHGSRRRGMFQ